MKIEIKKGTLENVEDCVLAMNDCTLSDAYFKTEESRRNAVLEAINSDNTYIITCDDVCAGFVFFIREGAFHAFHYIHLISIRKEYRGMGLGKKLLEYVEKLLFESRDKIFLVVGDYNPDAKVFYEKLGYQFIGTIPNLYRKGISEDVMMKVYEWQ